MPNLKFGDILYNRLPEFYKYFDSKQNPQYPLKRFLQVLGGGLDALNTDIEAYINKFNIDTCNPAFLPHIARTLGLEFPYNASIEEQRKFIKNIVKLYRLKGTPTSFKFLGQQIFGEETLIDVYKQQYEEGMTPEEYLKIFLKVTADGERLDILEKEQHFYQWVEYIRPTNTIIALDYNLFYKDIYDLQTNSYVNYLTEKVIDLIHIEEFQNNITPFYLVDLLKFTETDYYKLSDIFIYENYFSINNSTLNSNEYPLSTIFIGIDRQPPTDEDVAFTLNYHETDGNIGLLLTPAIDNIKISAEEEILLYTSTDDYSLTMPQEISEDTFTNNSDDIFTSSTSSITRNPSYILNGTLNNFYLTSVITPIAVNY